MRPLNVPKFSSIGACIHVLWWILQHVQNEEQTKKSERNCGRSYLGNV